VCVHGDAQGREAVGGGRAEARGDESERQQPNENPTCNTKARNNAQTILYASLTSCVLPLCWLCVSFVGISGSLGRFFLRLCCAVLCCVRDRAIRFRRTLKRSNLHTVGIESHRHARVGRTRSSLLPSVRQPALWPPCALVGVCWRRAAPLQEAVVLRAMHAVRPAAQLASPQAALWVLDRSRPRRCCSAW
jgi:hypothetical protein